MQAWQTLPEGNLRDRATEILTKAIPAERVAEKDLLEQAVSNAHGTVRVVRWRF